MFAKRNFIMNRSATLLCRIAMLVVIAGIAVPGSAEVVSNVFTSFTVPGQRGPTMVNMIYGDNGLTTPVYTFHLPHGSSVTSLSPMIVVPAGATVSPIAINVTS